MNKEIKYQCDTCAYYDDCVKELNPQRTPNPWEAPRYGPIEPRKTPFAFGNCEKYKHRKQTTKAILHDRRSFE